jgi:hypothetical protein
MDDLRDRASEAAWRVELIANVAKQRNADELLVTELRAIATRLRGMFHIPDAPIAAAELPFLSDRPPYGLPYLLPTCCDAAATQSANDSDFPAYYRSEDVARRARLFYPGTERPIFGWFERQYKVGIDELPIGTCPYCRKLLPDPPIPGVNAVERA